MALRTTSKYSTWTVYDIHMAFIIRIGYPPNCTENEFACKDGGCIPMNKECDESFDCEDKSDEDKSYCEGIRKYDYHKQHVCVCVSFIRKK